MNLRLIQPLAALSLLVACATATVPTKTQSGALTNPAGMTLYLDVFYWIDEDFGYALSGQIGRQAIQQLGDDAYAQLVPTASR